MGVVITITNTEVQLIKRKWYELYKNGWHKHVDNSGNKWWIRYNNFK